LIIEVLSCILSVCLFVVFLCVFCFTLLNALPHYFKLKYFPRNHFLLIQRLHWCIINQCISFFKHGNKEACQRSFSTALFTNTQPLKCPYGLLDNGSNMNKRYVDLWCVIIQWLWLLLWWEEEWKRTTYVGQYIWSSVTIFCCLLFYIFALFITVKVQYMTRAFSYLILDDSPHTTKSQWFVFLFIFMPLLQYMPTNISLLRNTGHSFY